MQARNENNGRDVFILQQILKITPGFGLEGVFGPLRPPDISLPNSLPNWGRGRPARGPGRKTMETHIPVAIRTFLIPIAGEPPAPPVWLRTSHVLPAPARISAARIYLQSDCKFIPPASLPRQIPCPVTDIRERIHHPRLPKVTQYASTHPLAHRHQSHDQRALEPRLSAGRARRRKQRRIGYEQTCLVCRHHGRHRRVALPLPASVSRPRKARRRRVCLRREARPKKRAPPPVRLVAPSSPRLLDPRQSTIWRWRADLGCARFQNNSNNSKELSGETLRFPMCRDG